MARRQKRKDMDEKNIITRQYTLQKNTFYYYHKIKKILLSIKLMRVKSHQSNQSQTFAFC